MMRKDIHEARRIKMLHEPSKVGQDDWSPHFIDTELCS